MRKKLHVLDHLDAGLVAALDAEGEHRSGAFRQVFLGEPVERTRREAGIRHPGDGRMPFEKLGHPFSVGDVPLHAQMERLDAGQDHEGIERRERGAEIAQAHGAGFHGVAEIAEGLREGEAVIGRVGLGHRRELAAPAPVELAGFDHDAAHRRAVAREELGHRVDHDVGAPFEWPAEIGRGHRVVDDERNARLAGDVRHCFEVDDDPARI